ALVAQAEDEVVEAVAGVALHDVPEDGPAADGDHRLGGVGGGGAGGRPPAAPQDHDLPALPPLPPGGRGRVGAAGEGGPAGRGGGPPAAAGEKGPPPPPRRSTPGAPPPAREGGECPLDLGGSQRGRPWPPATSCGRGPAEATRTTGQSFD